MTARCVREQCKKILDLARDGGTHFELHDERLGKAADYVVNLIRRTWPNMDVPPHSRWRRLNAEGLDRNQILAEMLVDVDPMEAARTRVDLVLVSLLMDSGAGNLWTYRDHMEGSRRGRSEGLACAGFDMFCAGAFSSDPNQPLRVDAEALQELTLQQLEHGFQVTAENSLNGITDRLNQLHALGRLLAERESLFPDGRPGNLVDELAARHGKRMRTEAVFRLVLEAFDEIRPTRLMVNGVRLSDVWHHPALGEEGNPEAYIPFHKLSLWMTYSMLEPMIAADFHLLLPSELPGPANYRNGGLFLDLGVFVPRRPETASETHEVSSELVVEWRALTVAYLDKMAEAVRFRLDLSDHTLPFTSVLEATWRAGRTAALETRADGSPPLIIENDGNIL
ncbi:MAG: DUF1688 family protein [Acidobacteriota bacterium]|nr:DUF1688 family protein [Acidobacteriota bacterium]